MITIRTETVQDIPAIRKVNKLAFERDTEADLVDKLRETCPDLLSLVAEEDGVIVGHILFTPAQITGKSETINGMALAPMAILPQRQKEGIGSALVREGIHWLESPSCPFIIVLGHPEYYPRFGFRPAVKSGVVSQWPGLPDEVFMMLTLDHEQMSGFAGTAWYQPEFVLD